MPHFSWRDIAYDIKDYVDHATFVSGKLPKVEIPLDKMKLVKEPFEKVDIDIIGPLSLTQKRTKYILSMHGRLRNLLTRSYSTPKHIYGTIC